MQEITEIHEIQPKSPSEFLGNDGMHSAAIVWSKNTDILEKIQKFVLTDFCERYEFNKEEYDAFKRGAASVIDVFYNSFVERSTQEFKAFQEEASKKTK